jgi:tetratricopeptide (TPR) repeat protein
LIVPMQITHGSSANWLTEVLMLHQLRILKILCLSGALWLGGCVQLSRSMYLSGYDRDIKSAANAIDTAPDNARRAEAYVRRGRAYSDKARYSRFFKLIPAAEYDRLFALAVQDHDRAAGLDPKSAGTYFGRGQSYYDRASVEEPAAAKAWFGRAAADFERAVAIDGRHQQALDMLGLAHESAGNLDQAIDAYTKEMALDRLGRNRLAEAYCTRGAANQKDGKNDAAIADYEKSIGFGAKDDGCTCEPSGPLAYLRELKKQN